ncbi:Type 1 glutamine amidotransferase-like domain-containing protein [Streptomyces sp. NPDC059627]
MAFHERRVSWVREADALLVNGGDALYLCHWMRESGLAGLFPSLHDTVYVGLSAGSMVLTPRVGEHFVDRTPPAGDDGMLGVVDFSLFPHLDSPDCPEHTMAEAERWAAGVEVVSEGHWKLFNPVS